jgi:large subunit ribosomal protein L23
MVGMNSERLMRIILTPCVSEKSTILAEEFHQFTFKVLPDATKPEIKQAVESLFNVKVDAVRVCHVKGKQKQFKQKSGKRKNWKKAYVTLKKGYDLNFASITS